MSVGKGIFGALGLLVLLAAPQLPAQAQATVEDLTTAQNTIEETQPVENIQMVEQTEVIEEIQVVEDAQFETEALQSVPAETGAAALTSPTEEPLAAEEPLTEEPLEVAQFSRRTSGVANSSFLGVGVDIGYADDVSLAIISKIALADRLAVRPSVLIGDDVALLVPVTYDFRQYAPEVGGFQFIPYGGVGAAYNFDDDSELNLLLSAGVDVPVARQITVNAQANLGVFNDTDFGVTVGAAYNIGNFF